MQVEDNEYDIPCDCDVTRSALLVVGYKWRTNIASQLKTLTIWYLLLLYQVHDKYRKIRGNAKNMAQLITMHSSKYHEQVEIRSEAHQITSNVVSHPCRLLFKIIYKNIKNIVTNYKSYDKNCKSQKYHT